MKKTEQKNRRPRAIALTAIAALAVAGILLSRMQVMERFFADRNFTKKLDQGAMRLDDLVPEKQQITLEESNTAPNSPQTTNNHHSAINQLKVTDSSANLSISKNQNLIQLDPANVQEPQITPNLFQRSSRVKTEIQTYFSRLSTDDSLNQSTSELLSNLNFAAVFGWIQTWTETFYTEINATLKYESYQGDPTNQDAVLENAQKILASVGISFHEQFYTRVKLRQSFYVAQEIYEYGLQDGTGVALKTALIPKAEVGVEYKVVDLNPFEVYSSLKAIVSGPGLSQGFKTQWGYGYSATIGIAQKFKSGSCLYAEASYGSENFKTSISKSKRLDLKVSVGYLWRFGE